MFRLLVAYKFHHSYNPHWTDDYPSNSLSHHIKIYLQRADLCSHFHRTEKKKFQQLLDKYVHNKGNEK